MWVPGKSGTAIITPMFSWRATFFKTGHQKDNETIQGDGQCDLLILNRQAKMGRTGSTTRRCISLCTRPSSEQQKRDQWTLWFHKILHLDYLEWSSEYAHPYRLTPVQALMPRDVQRHYDFCNFIMNHLQIQPTFLADIIWMDQASFLHNTMYNKQNIHSCSLENPRCIFKVRHQVCWLINVWCGMYKNRLIGRCFTRESYRDPDTWNFWKMQYPIL